VPESKESAAFTDFKTLISLERYVKT